MQILSNQLVMKLENENKTLRSALSRVNNQLGCQFVVDSSDESISEDINLGSPKANTRYHQLDELFSAGYFYITDVSLCTPNFTEIQLYLFIYLLIFFMLFLDKRKPFIFR